MNARIRTIALGVAMGAVISLTVALTMAPFTPLDATRIRALVALAALAVWRAWARDVRKKLFAGAALAMIAASAYHGFENPLGKVHTHDVFHYYMGSKYAPELGYTGLYDATLAAEVELDGWAVSEHRVRDLATDALVTEKDALAKHAERSFEPARWKSFVHDVQLFRAQMGPDAWDHVYVDHGYNPPPTWTLIGRVFASLGEPTHGFLAFLASFDLVLFVLIFGAIAWGFRLEVACVALIFFGAQYPASATWLEGNFLRLDWLACIVIGICCLGRRRWATAGALLGAAAALRLFPAALFFGPIVVVIARRSVTRSQTRFFAGAAGAVVGLVLLSVATLGPKPTREFVTHIQVHASVPGANHMGVPTLLMFDPSGKQEASIDTTSVDPVAGWRHAREERYRSLRPVHLVLLALAAAAVAWCTRKRSAMWLTVVLSVPLIFVATQLACYYAAVLVALVPAARVVPRLAGWILGLGALTSILGTMPAFSEVVTNEYATQSVLALALGAATLACAWPRRSSR